MSRSCTLKGTLLPLSGPELRVGDTAPDATIRKDLVSDVKLSDSQGKLKIISVVPSLDTPVCAEQTKRFNQRLSSLDNLEFLTISCDLPPAQSRFCTTEGIDADKIKILSDHKDLDFGHKFGTLIPDVRIECRAVFVIDTENKIQYAEYVPEVTDHPNYDAVMKRIKSLLEEKL